MQPMRIRAYLLDGRIAGTEAYFPLDSILAAEWIRRHHPGEFYNPPPPGMETGWIEAELPLERRGQGNDWYWASSFNQSAPKGEYIAYWNRRFDDQFEQYIDMKGKRGKISISSGRYKAYRSPLNILLFNFLEWYAVGDIDAINELCSGIVAIGKKPAQGYGLIEKWEIVPWSEDWSEIGPGNKIMRALLQLPPKVNGTMRLYGFRPPYWAKKNQRVVYMPC